VIRHAGRKTQNGLSYSAVTSSVLSLLSTAKATCHATYSCRARDKYPVHRMPLAISVPLTASSFHFRRLAKSSGLCELLYEEHAYDLPVRNKRTNTAHEARIYWDAGTGTADFSEPHATVEMGYPTRATRFS